MEESNPSGTEWTTVQPVKVLDTETQQEIKTQGERILQVESMLKTIELTVTGQIQVPAQGAAAAAAEPRPPGQVAEDPSKAGVPRAD